MPYRLIAFISVPLLVLVDQISKWAVLEHVFRPLLGLGDPMRFMDWLHNAPERFDFASLPVLPFFNLTMVWNFGVSFGLLSNQLSYGPLLLKLLAGIIALGFAIWLYKTTKPAEMAGLALIIGGAIGNMLDRARFGAVADFFDFHWQGVSFPAFNIADAAITLGVVVLLVYGLFFDKIPRKDTAS